MKSLKMLGLAAVAAAALMAFIGAGSASATTLCSTNPGEGGGACGSVNPAGTTYTGSLKSGSEATLAAGFSTIKCKTSAVTLEQTNAGGGAGTPVAGKINSLSFGECGTATVNVLSVGSGNLNWTEKVSGSLTGEGTNVEIVVGTTKCFYGGAITSGLTVTGGAPATGKATNVALTRESGSSALCANPSKWNAEYVFGQTAYVANS